MSYVVFLSGGIASGKSTVAKELAARGAACVDLDELSRATTRAGSPVNAELAKAFGADVLDPRTGELRRDVLARRAFATDEATKTLEAITHPAIRGLLLSWLSDHEGDEVCVVEVQLLDRVQSLLSLADEVLCVTCPLELRRERAVARGMRACDFDARVAKQPTDDYLASVATTVLSNSGNTEQLLSLIDEWWRGRVLCELARGTVSCE